MSINPINQIRQFLDIQLSSLDTLGEELVGCPDQRQAETFTRAYLASIQGFREALTGLYPNRSIESAVEQLGAGVATSYDFTAGARWERVKHWQKVLERLYGPQPEPRVNRI